jgi:hypothetical protein
MTTREHINEYFNGRPFMILCALALMVATAVALSMGVQPQAGESTGIFFKLQGTTIGSPALSAAVNVLCLLVTGGIMLALNKVFSYVRSVTHLMVSAFFLLQLANPSGLVAFNAGTLLSLVTAMATLPLFAAFQDRHSQRIIFLIIALVVTGSMFHYGFLMLLPAFLLGFFNMGVFNLKGLLAMLFGLVTPFWIVLGLGIVAPSGFTAPHINGICTLTGQPWTNLTLVLAVITALLGIVLAVMNLMTIMNYRMQTRVYNAFFVFALVMAVIAMCTDYSNVTVYLPLLGLMTAVQIAHFHTLRNTFQHRYIFILLLIAGCIGLFAANALMP